jgi:hypothetical protein
MPRRRRRAPESALPGAETGPRRTIYVAGWLEAQERLAALPGGPIKEAYGRVLGSLEGAWGHVRKLQVACDAVEAANLEPEGLDSVFSRFLQDDFVELFRDIVFQCVKGAPAEQIKEDVEELPFDEVEGAVEALAGVARILLLAVQSAEAPEWVRMPVREACGPLMKWAPKFLHLLRGYEEGSEG